MKKIFYLLVLFCCSAIQAQTEKKITYNIITGANIGGSIPLPMPAEVREIKNYKALLNLSIGVQADYHINNQWGIRSGLKLEDKGMQTSARVANYHMSVNINQGDEMGHKEGYYTGEITNKTVFSYLTLPVMALYELNDRLKLEGGIYASYAIKKDFKGSARDGYIREDPTYPKVAVTEGSYDFSKDMRDWDFGLSIGADYRFYQNLSAFAMLNWGLFQTLDPDKKQVGIDMYNVYFSIGLSYKL
jgi:hypothetical protein